MNMFEIVSVATSVVCVSVHFATGRKSTITLLPSLILIWVGTFIGAKGFHPESISVLVRIAALLPGALVFWEFLERKPTSHDYFVFAVGGGLVMCVWSISKGVRLAPAIEAIPEITTAVWYGCAALITVVTYRNFNSHAMTFYFGSALLALGFLLVVISFYGVASNNDPNALTNAIRGEKLAASFAHSAGTLVILGAFYIANMMQKHLISDLDRKRLFKLFIGLCSMSILVKTPELRPLLSNLGIIQSVCLISVHGIAFASAPAVLMLRRNK